VWPGDVASPGLSASTGRDPIATVARSDEGLVRRASAWLHRHVWVRLGLVLGGPLLWMVVVYLGALGFLFVNAFWKVDPFSGLIQRQWGFTNFQTLWRESVYRIIVFRTAGIAAAAFTCCSA